MPLPLSRRLQCVCGLRSGVGEVCGLSLLRGSGIDPRRPRHRPNGEVSKMPTRKSEMCAALGAFLLVISGAGVAAPPETPEKIGTAIRNAQKDNANVLVVVDIAG